MSVLIKGAKLPKSCFGCHLFKLDDRDLWCIANHYAGCCRVLSKYIDENKFVIERHPDCPLIEVPTPHGRLIDADALINELASEHVGGLEAIKKYTNADTWTSGLHTAWRTIDDADTIIEAED